MKKNQSMSYGHALEKTRRIAYRDLPRVDFLKRISNYPVIKWFVNPFWAPKRWDVTVIPINVEVKTPDIVSIPRKIMERLIDQTDDIFIMDTCACRTVFQHKTEVQDIGCMAFGPGARRIHPSHGRFVNKETAKAHIEKAARAGLVANVAWTWIDPNTWGTDPFDRQLFTCFCDDKCFYRGSMQNRGPNLNRTHRKLPGISISVDSKKCIGCGICSEACFVAEMKVVNGIASIGKDCKACGRCIEVCSNDAIQINFGEEETLFSTLMDRLKAYTNISSDH
jgi:ferredoxin